MSFMTLALQARAATSAEVGYHAGFTASIGYTNGQLAGLFETVGGAVSRAAWTALTAESVLLT
jgi:hypothetical protein